jgi:serine/threonine protein kinase
LLEPCLGEDLFSILKKNKDGLPEDEVKRIIKQVAQAVKFMHMMDIIHRDLKPENILFH